MAMRKYIFILLLVAAIASLSVARKLSGSERLRFEYFAMEGMKQRQKGNAAAAADLFGHALEINPDADELVYALANYFEDADDSLFLSHIRRAIELNPANSVYQTELAAYYIRSNNYGEAIEILEQNYRDGVNKSGTLEVLVSLYMATDQPDMALDALNRIEMKDERSLATTLKKIQVYEQQSDTLAAYAALKSLADENSDDPQYKVMLGNWLVQKGKGDEARLCLEEALRQAPDDYNALMSLYDYYNSSGRDSLAQDMADRVLRSANTPQKDRARFMGNCMRSIYNRSENGDTVAAFAFFDKLLAANPNDSLAAYFRVSLMQTLDFPADSILPAMDKYFAIVPDDPEMRLRQAQIFAAQGDWQQTLAATRRGLEYSPDELVFYYFNAISLVQLEREREATAVLKGGLAKRGEGTNNELVADCYGFLGDMLHKEGHVAEAFAAYDSCLVYKPDHTSSLNNYAYYLSLSGRDLKKAELMSYQTVIEEPDNSTYLDTYAWILFQQGRYDDAQTYIDMAIKAIEDEAFVQLEAYHNNAFSIVEQILGDSIEVPTDSIDSVSTGTTGTAGQETDSLISHDGHDADSVEAYIPSQDEIQSIVTDQADNATIYEHAGDISYMNGHEEKALERWQTAAKCAKPDRLLQKKIKKRKYFPRKNVKL